MASVLTQSPTFSPFQLYFMNSASLTSTIGAFIANTVLLAEMMGAAVANVTP